ncbi:MAG TPA: LysR substrate-binding domain-containing protein [Dongiaceae bacterium]|jgi:DNA-binding transcriptional LysR family regulator
MPRIDLDFDLLRCFVAVAETRGFTAAGALIGLTQSGISVRIRNLEERLGKRLLHRTSRSVALTEAGELFLGYARRMIDLNDEAVGRICGTPAEGRLRLGIADYALPRLLPNVLGRFARLQPGVRMELRTGLSADLRPAFDHGELDVAIVARGQVFKDGDLLYNDQMVWVAAPAFELRLDRPLPIATLPSFCSIRRASLHALDRAGIGWEIVYESTSTAGMLAVVDSGLGIAAIEASCFQSSMRQLGEKDGLPALPRSEIAIHVREETLSPGSEAFIAFIREELKAA